MKISTTNGSIAKLVGDEKAIEYIAKAGFDAWDISMYGMCRFDEDKYKFVDNEDYPLGRKDYLKYARKLKQIGLDNGIICNQTHAPDPSNFPGIKTYIKRSIECTAEAGAKFCVVHPAVRWTTEENVEFFHELLPFAKEHGVKIAAENMFDWDYDVDHAIAAACSSAKRFKELIDAVNDDYLVACVDLGHAELKGLESSAVEMIKALKNNVQVLHIQDNDRWHDSHNIPFSMDIDFPSIVKALKEIGYEGYFTLEANVFQKGMPYGKDNVFEGVVAMRDSAKKLADMFDNL